MFTTMNCNFLETEFFYNSQLNGQGEKEKTNTLSWLKWIPSSGEINHSVQNESSSSSRSGEPRISVTEQNLPNLMSSEVSASHDPSSSNSSQDLPSNDPSEELEISNHNDQEAEKDNQETSSHNQETTGRYTLPPRANRGVPPKRYSPEKQLNRNVKYPMANIANGDLSKEAKAFTSSLYTEETPNSVEQALASKKWKEAMENEMEALVKNETLKKCSLPTGKKPVGCRWVFTVKHKPDGTVERYKAHLVAKGYTQT